MKKRKIFVTAAALLMVGVSIVGLSSCNNQDIITVDDNLPTDDPTSEIKINFWECLGQSNEGNLGKIVSSFNTKYDGRYKVVLSKVAGDYDSLHSAVKTKLAAGEVPALCMGYPDSFSEYMTNSVDNSSILRLDNFINDKTYGYSNDEIKDFIPEYYNEGKGYQFDGVWSMPMYKSTEVMYYNENYFSGDNPQSQAKLASDTQYINLRKKVTDSKQNASATDLAALKTYTNSKGGYVYSVPVTWEEMKTVGLKMQADRKAAGISDEFYSIGYDSDANMFISQFAQRGISYTVNDENSKNDPDKHFTFVNSEAKAFASEVKKMNDDKILITKGTLGGSKYTNEYFTSGKSAMSIGSTGGSTYNVSSNFKVSLAAVPYSGTSARYIMQGPSICFFNNDDSYIHKGAWLFYKELADVDNNTALALENSYDPIRRSCYETESYRKWIGNAGKGLKYDIPNITSTLKEFYMTSPSFVGSSTARTEVGKILQNMTRSGYTVDKAFEIAYNTCTAAV